MATSGVENLFLGAVLSSSVASVVVSALLLRRSTRVSEEIRNDFARRMAVFTSDRKWREASVTELLGPIYMQFDRTKRAMGRWKAKNLYLESKVMREGNLVVRDLLLSKGHLVPRDLLDAAGDLVAHYDRWLEEFERCRGEQNPNPDAEFVFVAPEGYPFPRKAERSFRERFLAMRDELYATKSAEARDAPAVRSGSGP